MDMARYLTTSTPPLRGVGGETQASLERNSITTALRALQERVLLGEEHERGIFYWGHGSKLGVKALKSRNILAFEPGGVTRIKICNLKPDQ